MHTGGILAASLIAAAAPSVAASPPSALRRDPAEAASGTTSPNSFSITNFVFGCTTTCDWSLDVTNAGDQPPPHPAFTTPVHCSGSKDTTTSFGAGSCGPISSTQHVAAYIDANDTLHMQYQVFVPDPDPRWPGATYWYEGEKAVGAQTGYEPSPPAFEVPETKAYAIA